MNGFTLGYDMISFIILFSFGVIVGSHSFLRNKTEILCTLYPFLLLGKTKIQAHNQNIDISTIYQCYSDLRGFTCVCVCMFILYNFITCRPMYPSPQSRYKIVPSLQGSILLLLEPQPATQLSLSLSIGDH